MIALKHLKTLSCWKIIVCCCFAFVFIRILLRRSALQKTHLLKSCSMWNLSHRNMLKQRGNNNAQSGVSFNTQKSVNSFAQKTPVTLHFFVPLVDAKLEYVTCLLLCFMFHHFAAPTIHREPFAIEESTECGFFSLLQQQKTLNRIRC